MSINNNTTEINYNTKNKIIRPPQFKESMSYKSWKNKIEMWKLVTTIPKKEQAIIVLLESLEKNTKAETAASEFTVKELNSEDGMHLLISKLDKIFQTETTNEAYITYSKFITFSRSKDVDISDYISEYDNLYKRMQEFDMNLPDPVLAYQLLNGVNISDDEKRLALTICSDMKYENMKCSLKNLMSKLSASSISNIRKEALQNKNHKINKSYQCIACDSENWADKCRHKQQSDASSTTTESDSEKEEEANMVLITEDIETFEKFDTEIFKTAVVNSNCTKTVVGHRWFHNYISNLTKQAIKEIDTHPANTVFVFSNGLKVKSVKRVVFPVLIAEKHCKINAEIIEKNIPLLLSKSSLKKCKTTINISERKANIFGQDIILHRSPTGHYCIDILPTFSTYNNTQELVLESNLPFNNKVSQIEKIHTQFGHASDIKIKELIRTTSTLIDTEMLKLIHQVVNNCQTCIKFRKPEAILD